MSKVIYVCVRDIVDSLSIKNRLSCIIDKILPDNIPETRCKVESEGHIIYAISQYVDIIKEQRGSVCLGVLNKGASEIWPNVDTEVDGSFAIFRSNKKIIEVVSDAVGSRTIWYYKDEKLFVASTSQRLIVALIKKFELDKRVLPWILSTGTLGPSFSWDANINRLSGGASLKVDRDTWLLTIKQKEVIFKPSLSSEHELNSKLKDVIKNSIQNLHFDPSQWILPISGGYDSRGIACFLKETGVDCSKIKTITWGLEKSINKPKTDANVAIKVAKSLGMPHQYFKTELSDESIDNIVSRFFKCGEGRIDHLSAYADGLFIWKMLVESGIQGIIRGDEGFGWHKVVSELNVRYSVGLVLCSDIANFENIDRFGFEKQEIPIELLRKNNETLDEWRDRLYHQYRLPVILAALSDVKLSYVEIVNPLLSEKIISFIRTIPDHLRTDKYIFKKIINSISPNIEFASKGSIETAENIFKLPAMVNMIRAELSEPYLQSIFSKDFLEEILNKINLKQPSLKKLIKIYLKKFTKKILPLYLKSKIHKYVRKPTIDNNRIAFRVFMVGRMYKIFTADVNIKSK